MRKASITSSIAIPKRRKQAARKRKSHTPTVTKGSDSVTKLDIRIEQDQLVRNEEENVHNEESPIHNEGKTMNPEASSFEALFKSTVESLLKRIMKDHTYNDAKMNRVVSDSAEVCKTMTEKCDKLISDTTNFMEKYQTTHNNSIVSTNTTLKNLGSLLKDEKDNWQDHCTSLQKAHE
ncbi:unnamed protein product [Lactuca saligna]|uniref:Uncharacterized protein n=1 Tax=Lactuca saligna TaxID=75948 RepID=A0AA35YEH7_LACSI|nr:unnamed protein product [Lactuca saligna]